MYLLITPVQIVIRSICDFFQIIVEAKLTSSSTCCLSIFFSSHIFFIFFINYRSWVFGFKKKLQAVIHLTTVLKPAYGIFSFYEIDAILRENSFLLSSSNLILLSQNLFKSFSIVTYDFSMLLMFIFLSNTSWTISFMSQWCASQEVFFAKK